MRTRSLLVAGALLCAAGCGGDDDTDVDTSIVEAVNEQRQHDNCEAEFKTLDVAGQAFFAVHPDATAVTEEQLVGEKFLRQEMPNHDIEADGTVLATDDGACT